LTLSRVTASNLEQVGNTPFAQDNSASYLQLDEKQVHHQSEGTLTSFYHNFVIY